MQDIDLIKLMQKRKNEKRREENCIISIETNQTIKKIIFLFINVKGEGVCLK